MRFITTFYETAKEAYEHRQNVDSLKTALENKQAEVNKLLDQASEMKAREEADRTQLVLLQDDNNNKAKVIGSL